MASTRALARPRGLRRTHSSCSSSSCSSPPLSRSSSVTGGWWRSRSGRRGSSSDGPPASSSSSSYSVVVPRTKAGRGKKVSTTNKENEKRNKSAGSSPSLELLRGYGVQGDLGRGDPSPLGPSWVRSPGSAHTLNLAVFSDVSTGMAVCLFTKEGLERNSGPALEIELDPRRNRTGHVWHCSLQFDVEGPGEKPYTELFYAYRVSGVKMTSKNALTGEPEPGPGVVFNPDSGDLREARDFLVDPYAVAIASRARWGQLASEEAGAPDKGYDSITERFGPCWAQHACCLPSVDGFDWEGDKPLNLRMEDLVIYELHVRGFTQHASSNVKHPGTYKGLTEKLDYLQDLGVNCVELMPVNEFNELEYYELSPPNGVYRYNVWGYSTVGFFAPMARYGSCLSEGGDLGKTGEVVKEFKEMVKMCHQRGIEVIIDVVFNHTAEGNEHGPCLSFRGLGNRVYYMLAPQGEYYNYSGCGNTVNCNHPVTREFILDCLRYWVVEMHVDGFRFDLASILSRNHSSWTQLDSSSRGAATEGTPQGGEVVPLSEPARPLGGPEAQAGDEITAGCAGEVDEYVHDDDVPTGKPLSDPPLLQAISTDPVLKDTKLIAEAWDCDGLNQVGSFPHYGGRWSEWNGIFRDNVRNFIKGSDGPWAGTFAGAICGSPDVYGNAEPGEGDWWGSNDGRIWRGTRGPTASINFVTAHDGFTLADLVSYNSKHNEANGEQNNDGEQHNNSWNCGQEGKSEDQGVIELRHKQLRNFAAVLLVSQGVPMLVMGDEYGHSKGGNNNTYCHDGDINYFQWDVCEKQEGLVRFFRKMIHLRRGNSNLRQSAYMDGSRIQWHGVKASEPDWSDTSRFVAFSVTGDAEADDLYIAFNAGHSPLMIEVPAPESGSRWEMTADTSKPAPYDFLDCDEMLGAEDLKTAKQQSQTCLDNGYYTVAPYSCIILTRVVKEASSDELDDFSISSFTISRPAERASKPNKPKKPRKAKAPKIEPPQKEEEDETLLGILEENRRLKALLEAKKRKK
ncbi:isoamylase [Chloropicon primus]|uniref:Isoamylase n=3 Tax=Chloropicon primus TaxID=1764295 RepID=A0A5B8MFZ4_9CHLO|nr:isoamylase [Chloropicon primus]UPQ97471.1 isoamylase [Chloropicon primus]|eukprot:QDZ18260.1 isoamylase [Chloropicon primus]